MAPRSRARFVGHAQSVSQPSRRVVGLQRNSLVLTWPLVVFDATSQRLEFTARIGLGRFIGPWTIRRAEVNRICHTPRGSLPPGVEIWTTNHDRWVVLAPPRNLLTELAALGYPVESSN